MIELRDVKLKISDPPELLYKRAASMIGVRADEIADVRILRRSLDARKKPQLFYVYSLGVSLRDGARIPGRIRRTLHDFQQTEYRFFSAGREVLKERPVVVGAGPAGLFCAYLLAEAGYRPLILERGEAVEERRKSVEAFFRGSGLNTASNVQFGEGGAGTFSDGKLTTQVKDDSGRNRFVLETFVRFGAPEDILYEQKPHLGTDRLVDILTAMRREIGRLGGEYRFGTKVEEIETRGRNLDAVVLEDGEKIPAGCAAFAIGHSARDTFRMLHRNGLSLIPKPFAVGVRVEHPQEMIDLVQYGSPDSGLPPAAYRLTAKAGERGIYTFCMCPGGYVVNASSEEGRLCVNGMSYRDRASGNANSAVVAAVSPEQTERFLSEELGIRGCGPFFGMRFQEILEERAYSAAGGNVPVQLFRDFRDGSLSTGFGEVEPKICGKMAFGRVDRIFPEEIRRDLISGIESFGTHLTGYDRPDAIVSGVESRTSSPVRIPRDADFVSEIDGLYPCGEGAGYAGGIMSAAMDGMKTAEKIAGRFRPIDVS